MAKRKSATQKNIDVINRRLNLIANLFGVHSTEYEEVTNLLHGYEFDVDRDTGRYRLRDTKANREQYRQIGAWARQIKRTPYQLVKRRAEKAYKSFEDYRETTDDNRTTFEAYQYWANEIGNLKDEVYQLVNDGENELLLDEEEHNYNIYLMLSDQSARFDLWQELRKLGYYDDAFPVEDYTEVEYTVDENGEVFTNDAFFGDI